MLSTLTNDRHEPDAFGLYQDGHKEGFFSGWLWGFFIGGLAAGLGVSVLFHTGVIQTTTERELGGLLLLCRPVRSGDVLHSGPVARPD